jgi:GTPase Era involved in 16S rRNA processing
MVDMISQMDNIVVLLKAILSKKNKQKDIKTVEDHLQNIKNRETSILVCGEFKRGKSSFINAFLEQDLCPVDTNIATAVVSIIKYGEKVKITRQYGDFSNLKSDELTSLDQIEHYAKGKAEEIDNTVLLEIEVPNQKLKSGIVLIDTPGIGGLDPRHAFLTNYYLPKADITLFVTDKDSPMSATEIDFFEKKIAPYSRQSAILVNKADKFSSEEEQNKWIADVRNKCKNAKTDIKVIPVSSKLKLDYLKSKDAEDLTESNFEAVEKEIASLTETFKRNFLLELKSLILNLLEELHKPLVTQIEQIKMPDPNLIERLKNEMKGYEEQERKLSDPNSEYRLNLTSIINQAKTGVELRLQEESILLSASKLQELANSPQARANHNWLLEQVNNAISSLASELDLMIDTAFDQVMFMVGSDKESSAFTSQFDYQIHVNLTPAERSLGTVACDTARQTLPAVGIFSLVAGLASVVFTGGLTLPLLLGGGAALSFLGKNVSDASKRNDTNYFITKLNPQIQIAVRHLSSYIGSRFAEFQQNLLAVLQEGMKRVKENKSAVVNSLTKLSAETAQQQQLKSKLLTDELKPVENLIAVTKLFLSNPFEKQ